MKKTGVLIGGLLLAVVSLQAQSFPVLKGVAARACAATAYYSPASLAVDGDSATAWQLEDGAREGWLELRAESPALIHGLVLQADPVPDLRVEVEYRQGAFWTPFSLSPLPETALARGLADLSFDKAVADAVRL